MIGELGWGEVSMNLDLVVLFSSSGEAIMELVIPVFGYIGGMAVGQDII